MHATALLEQLGSRLGERGWPSEIRNAHLRVSNPNDPGINADIECDGDAFRWARGQSIGPVDETAGVADRIQHVLREPGR